MKKSFFILKACNNYEKLCKHAAGTPFDPSRFIGDPSRPIIDPAMGLYSDPATRVVDPTAPIDPTRVVDPTAPIDPTRVADPTTPIDPARVADPNAPSQAPSGSPTGQPSSPFSNPDVRLNDIKIENGQIKIPDNWLEAGKIKTNDPNIPEQSAIEQRIRELKNQNVMAEKAAREESKNRAETMRRLNDVYRSPLLSQLPSSKAIAGLTIFSTVVTVMAIFSKDKEKVPVMVPAQSGIAKHVLDTANANISRIKANLPTIEKIKTDMSSLNSSLENMKYSLTPEDSIVIDKYITRNNYITSLLDTAGLKTATLSSASEIKTTYDFYFEMLVPKLNDHITKLRALHTRLNKISKPEYTEPAINAEKVIDALSIYVAAANNAKSQGNP